MRKPIYTPEEERWNYLSHGLASVLSIAGLLLLLVRAIPNGDMWVIAGITVFSICMTIGFLSSTVYHWVEIPKFKKHFRILDHVAIYLFIAGSYTPFALVSMREEKGMFIFLLIWGLALLGMSFKYYIRDKLDQYVKTDLLIYIMIGCVALLFIKPMMQILPMQCIILLGIGGAFYLIGALFYAWKSFPYNHAIWHLLVILGATSHYMCVYWFVIPKVA